MWMWRRENGVAHVFTQGTTMLMFSATDEPTFSSNAEELRISGSEAGSVQVWYHIAISYDHVTHTKRIVDHRESSTYSTNWGLTKTQQVNPAPAGDCDKCAIEVSGATPITSTGDIILGANADFSSHFNGMMDEFRIHNSVLPRRFIFNQRWANMASWPGLVCSITFDDWANLGKDTSGFHNEAEVGDGIRPNADHSTVSMSSYDLSYGIEFNGTQADGTTHFTLETR
jgi:hypothetical protein